MSSSWWDRKLGGAPTRESSTPPMLPTPSPRVQAGPAGETLSETGFAWKGGDGTRMETANCPMCGSDLFFSRSNAGSVYTERGAAKAPGRCYSCGYTEGREMQGIPPA